MRGHSTHTCMDDLMSFEVVEVVKAPPTLVTHVHLALLLR